MKLQMVLVALLLVGFVPMVEAQAKPFMEDGAGDTKAYLAGTPTTPPGDMGAALDLKALYFTEVPNGFQTTIEVASLESQQGTIMDGAYYRVYFHYGGVDYAIRIQGNYGLLGEGPYYWAELGEVIMEDGYEYMSSRADMQVTVSASEGRMTVTAPREAITDALGAPAGAGAVFKDFYVLSQGTQIWIGLQGNGPTYVVRDRMPDDGVFGSFTATMGVVQEGDARLRSDAPFRLSNGGATSMVYQVEASNAGERQTFHLAMQGIPDGWDVRLPFDRLALDAGQAKTFPILVTTPNGHQHGGTQSFLLTMTGQQDKSDVGRMEIGISYPEIPQPAGHHPQLWIHSYEAYQNGLGPVGPLLGGFGSSVQGYMNAAEEDPSDLGVPIPAWGNNIPGLNGYFNWWIPLVPELGMGLDFDTTQQATFSIPINYDYIAQDVVLRGNMYLWTEASKDGVHVGSIQPSTPTSWGPGIQTFDLVMDVNKEADFIPYSPNAYLYLTLDAQGTFLGPGPFGPGSQAQIMPGATLTLPLIEYRDEVQSFYGAVEALRFGAEFIERPVNPGKTVIFETHLRNIESETQTVKLNLSGVNTEWARILGSAQFQLGAGKERTVAVAVAVPADMSDGAVADLVLTASNVDDPFKTAIIDLIAVVDTDAQHPDESGRIGSLDVAGDDDKKVPGFEIVAVALGLVAIALVLRRRA